MRLSEGSPFKTLCKSSSAQLKLSRANRYENEMVKTYRDLSCSGASRTNVKKESKSMRNMTGRPGHWTMEMNGGSSAPYLARTPCVPLFCTLFTRDGNRMAFRLPGAGGGSCPLYGGTFARSYSVSKQGSRGLSAESAPRSTKAEKQPKKDQNGVKNLSISSLGVHLTLQKHRKN